MKFEAGTQNAGGAVGFAAAVEFMKSVGYEKIEQNERHVMRRLIDGLRGIPHVHITCDNGDDIYNRRAVVSFAVEGVHSHDVSTILNESGVAVRAGKHCAHPLLDYLGVEFRSTSRASVGCYTDESDIDRLIEALPNVRRIMGYGNI